MNRLRYALALLAVASPACALNARSTLDRAPTRVELAELWMEPADLEQRDLFYGPGGRELAPGERHFEFVALDTKGNSQGYDVRDSDGLEWSVKVGIEAQPEVVVSRLLWAIGYHQPPTYYVPSSMVRRGRNLVPVAPARFRPEVTWMKKEGEWEWSRNPFVGTRELRSLFVFMVLVNNWDLKTPQNALYAVTRPQTEVRRWYVVRDLGASLGGTRWFIPGSKNDVESFEREPFIKNVEQGRVRFHFDGGWREPHLKRDITPGDVRWTCSLLDRLSDQQMRDAFRAAGYQDDLVERFVRRLEQKIEEGLKLPAD